MARLIRDLEPESVLIELTRNEVVALLIVAQFVGGDAVSSGRAYIDNIRGALLDTNIRFRGTSADQPYRFPIDHIRSGGIYFAAEGVDAD